MSYNPNSSLIESARLGSLDGVMKALENGADINYADENGDSALVIAINAGHTGIARFLATYPTGLVSGLVLPSFEFSFVRSKVYQFLSSEFLRVSFYIVLFGSLIFGSIFNPFTVFPWYLIPVFIVTAILGIMEILKLEKALLLCNAYLFVLFSIFGIIVNAWIRWFPFVYFPILLWGFLLLLHCKYESLFKIDNWHLHFYIYIAGILSMILVTRAFVCYTSNNGLVYINESCRCYDRAYCAIKGRGPLHHNKWTVRNIAIQISSSYSVKL